MIALNHEEPDRTPIDIGGMLASGFNKIVHDKLKKFLHMRGGKTQVVHMMQQEVRPDERIRSMFGGDTYGLWSNSIGNRKLAGNMYIDEWGVKYRLNKSGYYYEIVEFPLKNAQMKNLEEYRWPNPYNPMRTRGLAKKARELYMNTSLALIANGIFCSGPFQHCAWLLGLEDYLAKMLLDKEFSRTFLEKALKFHLDYWDMMLNAVGEYVQVVAIADDLGSNDAPLINPDLYREMVKPYHEKLISFIKEKANVKVLLHTDGDVYPLIPDFIEIGVDALNPVQYSAREMDTKKLKEEFGEKLTFWGGGCDTQQILPFESPDKVREEVKRRICDLAPNGGFVFAPVHNIQLDTPPENIVALYTAALEYGVYL